MQIGSIGIDTQKPYAIPELLMLAVKLRFLHLYREKDIKVFTDHCPLKVMFNKETTEVENSNIERMFESISHIDYSISYITGNQNCVADALVIIQSDIHREKEEPPRTMGYVRGIMLQGSVQKHRWDLEIIAIEAKI